MAKTAWQGNSLLESLVFARRAAQDMAEHDLKNASPQNASEIADYLASHVDFTPYQDIQTLAETYHHLATFRPSPLAKTRRQKGIFICMIR